MKKILMGMLAVALMLGVASCKEKAPADAAKDVAEKVPGSGKTTCRT